MDLTAGRFDGNYVLGRAGKGNKKLQPFLDVNYIMYYYLLTNHTNLLRPTHALLHLSRPNQSIHDALHQYNP